ncbi:M23 family metallopeptidase [Brucepastera parasyntrophica]|uniref:M23 family metallopeptidase n=1 Tax=Brucepastera parasyntrophica TaxID=2880008 RepID=UPI00210A6BEE|nr:M23 family metallopeptidase [Brucepastera parasyntrophica]ULQ60643.1 M23 family metallopeptidase [Brucepastera parasyntrophica]
MNRRKLAAACGILTVLSFFSGVFASGKREQREYQLVFGAGRPDPAKHENNWTITAPAACAPGDMVTVLFISEYPIAAAQASILDLNGVKKSEGLPFPEKAGTEPESEQPPRKQKEIHSAPVNAEKKYTQIAFLPLSTFLEPGNYILQSEAETGNTVIKSTTPFTVLEKEFITEELYLNSRNTAIRTDTSPERDDQIKRLNAILFSQNNDAPRFAGPYILPLSSIRRTSQFAERRIYRYNTGRTDTSTHYGVDFGVPIGTPVFASGDGIIVMAENRISTGWTIVIEHLPGVFSLYYHLDTLAADVGEYVRAGTLIGKSGNTGLSTGPHLHWEFRVNGAAVSPDFFVGTVLYEAD